MWRLEGRRWWLVGVLVIGAAILAVIVVPTVVRPRLPPGGTDGGDGIGDPYFPDAGGGGYDALSYRIALDYDEPAQSLAGSTVVLGRTAQTLSAFHVDLGLDVDSVTVDGRPAQFRQWGWDVTVVPSRALPAGAEFRAEIAYHGKPADAADGHESAITAKGRELVIANEPRSAPFWFAANDHPSDPAQMDLTVTIPSDLQAISVGNLVAHDPGPRAATDTWHWTSPEPMATYLNFLAIGQFEIEQGTVNQRPFVYAASQQLDEGVRDKAMAALRRTPAVIGDLEQAYGPYPFSAYGGLVTAANVPFDGLETQTRPVYSATSFAAAPDRLLSHELSHMWFGDSVTLSRWSDIFVNEAYGSYSEWLYDERHNQADPNRAMRTTFDQVGDGFWRIRMDDPGPDQLFTTVYRRGPMALQALRNLIGDQAFFALARDWADHPGTRSLEDWKRMAQRHTSVDLHTYFQVWLSDTTKPEATSANGFR